MTLFAAVVMLAAGAAAGGAAASDREFDRVRDLVETGRADSAAVILTGMLDTGLDSGGRVRALYLLSQAMNRLGRLGDEIRYLVMAREESGGSVFDDRITRDYARILLQTGNYDECIAVVDSFRGRDTGSPLWPDILVIAADALFQKAEYRSAFNLYGEVSDGFPDTAPGARAVAYGGICLYRLDIMGGATERFEGYLARYPDGPDTGDVLRHLGASYESLGNTRLAIATYQRLVIEYPYYEDIIGIYFRLGENYLATGQLAEAENAFRNFIANADPTVGDYETALLDLERIRLRNGDYYNEIAMYERFITDHPASSLTPRIIFDLARYYRVAGNPAQALEKYRILTTNEHYAVHADSAAFLIADLLAGEGDRAGAIASLADAAAGFDDQVRAQKYYLQAGASCEEWGDTESAIAWYDSAYTRNASDDLSVRALMGIARILKDRGRWREAGNIYDRIIADYPDNPREKEVYLALSDIHYLAGNLPRAAAAAEKAVKFADDVEKARILLYIAELYEDIDEQHALVLYGLVFNGDGTPRPDRTRALMRYGDLAERTGERAKAAGAYETVIDDGADSVAVNLARERLSSILTPE